MPKLLAAMLDRLLRHSSERGGVVYLTEQEIAAEMEAVARELGLPVHEALRKLDAGELDGTSAELRLRMLRYLRRPEDELQARAAA